MIFSVAARFVARVVVGWYVSQILNSALRPFVKRQLDWLEAWATRIAQALHLYPRQAV